MSDPVIKVFISFSSPDSLAGTDDSDVKKWAYSFRDRIHKLSGYSLEEIYLYPLARLTAEISAEIERDLQTAEHLICIVSDEYLESEWCVREFSLFTSRPPTNRSEPLFVFTPFLRGRADDLSLRIKQGIELMENKSPQFTKTLKPFAEAVWAKSIREADRNKRSLDLRRNDGPFQEKQLAEFLRRPRTHSLLDYAALSAYCLGADRYLSGGWGFSVAQVDEHGQGDDEFALPNSSHALNVIILRALRSFFIDSEIDELIEERRDALDAKGPQRNPFQTVQDRLPLFARLLACMAVDLAGEGELKDHAKNAFDALKGFDSSSRWTLALENGLDTEEYHVALLVCLSKAKEIKEAKNRRYWRLLEDAVSAHLDHLQDFKEMARGAIKNSDLFELLGAYPDSNRAFSPKEAARASIRWLMLGECEAGRELQRERLVRRPSSASLTKRIQDGITKRDTTVITMATVASLTAISPDASDSADIPASAKVALDVLYNDLFLAIDATTIVPTLNAVAWAAIILMAARECKFSASDKEVLRSCWKRGRELRKNRLDAISTLAGKADGFDKEKFDKERLETNILSLHASDASWLLDCLPRFERSLVVEASPEYRTQEFTGLLRNAKFWGPRPPVDENQPLDESQPPPISTQSLGGVLRVQENKQVELDSPGYRKMFLEPFTAITGINVRNLNGIKREFGGLDDKLVQFMGEIVVEEVYIPSPTCYIRDEEKTFAQRTNEITKALLEAKDVANGMDDLLWVKRGGKKDGHRWIHRSAIVQEPRSHGGSRVISWRFVEMSDVAKKLIVAEKLISDATAV